MALDSYHRASCTLCRALLERPSYWAWRRVGSLDPHLHCAVFQRCCDMFCATLADPCCDLRPTSNRSKPSSQIQTLPCLWPESLLVFLFAHRHKRKRRNKTQTNGRTLHSFSLQRQACQEEDQSYVRFHNKGPTMDSCAAPSITVTNIGLLYHQLVYWYS